MSETKYVHVRSEFLPDGTIALEVPTKDYLKQIFDTHSNKCFIKTGITILHPKDQFVKKVGREKASDRLQFNVATLENVQIDGTRHIYYFNFESELSNYSLVFSTISESPNVKLLQGWFHDNY